MAPQTPELLDQLQRQFANELHDSLLPLLFVARLQAEKLREQTTDPQQAAELQQLVDYLQQANREGRRLITSHHPPELTETDWHRALAHDVDRGLPEHGCEIELDLDRNTVDLPDAIAAALYRVAQEAIRNAVKHARAAHVTVTAHQESDAVTLSIRDDGQGFAIDQVPPEHFGIASMRGRISAIDGTFNITSSPEQGTTVACRIPRPDR